MVAAAGDARVKRAALVALIALAGCATPAERIAGKLEAAGVPTPQARCMGGKLAARLSYGQLDELNRVVKDSGGDKLSLNKLVDRLGNADPALVARLVETGLTCALG
ncbi:hypothetical protein [uncultured Sphingomonas sp.]|uniref:hypothetical protein n=1 Tax=uncultured Sphingomonas sp. TaxID=158754 RepID=UPI0035CA084A